MKTRIPKLGDMVIFTDGWGVEMVAFITGTYNDDDSGGELSKVDLHILQPMFVDEEEPIYRREGVLAKPEGQVGWRWPD